MDRVLGNAMSKDEIDAIIKSVDADLSGTIEFDEFLTLMSDPKFCNPDERRQVFDMFDKDGSGHICIVELKDAFRKLGELRQIFSSQVSLIGWSTTFSRPEIG